MAGLAAAEAASGDLSGVAAPSVTIVETTGRPGGVLGTVRRDGWLVERSADNFLTARPEAIDLARRIGLESEFVGVAPEVRRALIWSRSRGLPAPAGFRLLAPSRVGSILGTPLLSPAARLRVLFELFVPPRSAPDESLEQFVVRRLGREAFERIVQPLAAGIWTADPARLSMAAACPEFFAMERECGSLWRGERSRRRAAAAGGDAAAPLRSVPDVGRRHGDAARPPRRRAAAAWSAVHARHGRGRPPIGRRWLAGDRRHLGSGPLRVDCGGCRRSRDAGAGRGAAARRGGTGAVAATHRDRIRWIGDRVAGVPSLRHRPSARCRGHGRAADRGPKHPGGEFLECEIPRPGAVGCALLRVFIGGALDSGAVLLDDAALVERARNELAALLGVRGAPLLEQVDRWHNAMPQYHVGHLDRVAAIEATAGKIGGLALAGAAYRGVGIPQVIASGRAAAARVMRPGDH